MPSSASAVTSRALIRRAITGRRRDFAAAAVFFTTHQLGEALVPILVGVAIGQAVATGSVGALVFWLGMLALDFLVLSFSYRGGARAAERAEQFAGHRLRVAVADRVLQPGGGADLASGDLLSRASSDADRVGAVASVVAAAVAAGAVVVGGTVFLLVLAPALGVVALAGTFAVIGATALAARGITRRSAREQEAAADATTTATDLVHGLRTLAGLGAGHAAAARFRLISRRTTRTAVHAADAGAGVAGVAELLTGLYVGVLLVAGGWIALSGGLSVGELVSSLGLAVFLAAPLQNLTGVPAALARARASADRIADVLTLDPAVQGGDDPSTPAGDVEVHDGPIAFGMPAGRLTAVVIDDPAESARILALLGRERDDADAGVRIGGLDIRDLPLERLRSHLMVSPHDAALFDTTLRRNIAGDDTSSIEEAARAAFADEVAARTSDGWEAEAGGAGGLLSGGQRQRIALARALAAEAPVLVLADPTTAVDAVTEDLIAERVRAYRAGRTTIVFTASPAFLSRADRVVFVHDGEALTGDHAALWRDHADYRAAVTR